MGENEIPCATDAAQGRLSDARIVRCAAYHNFQCLTQHITPDYVRSAFQLCNQIEDDGFICYASLVSHNVANDCAQQFSFLSKQIAFTTEILNDG
ncbi:hypothetical protein TN98_18965 [Pantoea anthophila]|nr:hypothetical protein TN98_18965 [Pantoea anthophila]